MKLFEAPYCEVAKNTKACLYSDLESQTYLRLLYNMVWSKIDTVDKKEKYFEVFMAHQKAGFDEIEEDNEFLRKDDNTLYVPKDSMAQSSVLSNIFEKRLKTEANRDIRHLYESELTKTDDDRFAIYGKEIERIIFLTDNMASGTSTIAALAAQLGIEKIEEYDKFKISADRIKLANAARHKYFCEGQEISVGEIIRSNQIKITVHAYYGTDAACKKVDDFLHDYDIPFEKSTYCHKLSKKANEEIIESASVYIFFMIAPPLEFNIYTENK